MNENYEKPSKLYQENNIILSERRRIDYDAVKKDHMETDKDIILLQIKKKIQLGKSIIYDNQEECSLSILSKLCDRRIINIMIVALTQSGKTGTMNALIKNYLKCNIIPQENIYIITGLSSCEWVEQTKSRIPELIQERVFHRENLTKDFLNQIKNQENVLIIIDELQIAAKENQTLYKAFKNAGFYDKQFLLKNDIKIIEFSATPDGTIYDLMNWGENGCKIQMKPGNGYTSCFDLHDDERVRQYKDLCGYNNKTNEINREMVDENLEEVKEDIDTYDEPMYHLIRTPSGQLSDIVVQNFKRKFGDDILYYKYDGQSEFEDVNKILSKKPDNHTFIFIKEKLRCAKTLYKKYLGISYERYTKAFDDAVVIQGLIGRGTGYDDNGQSIFYTNIESIEKYRKLWETNFEDKTVNWNSKTTKKKNDNLESKGTYKKPSLFDGMDTPDDENSTEIEPVIREFDNFNEAKKYIKDMFDGRGPNNPKKNINDDGYYENYIRGKRSVMDTNEVYDNRKWGIKKSYRLHVCYRNVKDKSTLKFWVIHY